MRKKTKPIVARNVYELASAIGLTRADAEEIQRRAKLVDAITAAVQRNGWTHARLARAAQTSRTRVTAILNRDTRGVSTDLLLRLLHAMGYEAKLTIVRSKRAA
jgi:predicted XRE-type DNA-binding protein